jgi:predicted PurR-regulated permease PerM
LLLSPTEYFPFKAWGSLAKSLEPGSQDAIEQAIERGAESAAGSEPVVVRMPVDVKSASLTLLAVVAAIAVLRLAQDVFIPIVLALLVSYALDPVVTLLIRLGIHRAIAAAMVLLILLAGVGIGGYRLRDEANAVLDTLPDAARRIRETIASKRSGPDPLKKVQQVAKEIEKTAAEATVSTPAPRGVTRVQVQEAPFRATDYLWWGSMGVVAFVGQATVVVFLVYFLLASGDLYKRKLVRIAGPSFSEKRLTVEILRDIDAQIEKFLVVQVLTSALVAVATTVVLWMLGVQYASVWGIAAGVLNSIPYLGPVVVTAGLALVAFLQFGTWSMVFYVAGIALLITTLEGFLLTPALIGKAASMNQVAVFVGLLFWSWLWGFWGAILAVPMLMVVKTMCDRIEGLQPLGELLGEKSG